MFILCINNLFLTYNPYQLITAYLTLKGLATLKLRVYIVFF